jgi:hypothetical protein
MEVRTPNERTHLKNTLKEVHHRHIGGVIPSRGRLGPRHGFHVGEDLVKEMHQWLAFVFVTAIALHVYRNWGAMMTYVRRRTIMAPLALAAVAAAVFIVPAALSGRDEPRHALMQSLQEAKLADLGRVLDVPVDSLVARLEKEGFMVMSAE